ncbi:MAG: FAD-binding protein [Cellulomonadaceae bacterium]|nr:FAD-binding protein [Cellulomonadaceae bacterium]
MIAAGFEGELDWEPRRRAEYSTDASIYRAIPKLVIFPATDADVVSALKALRDNNVIITARGGGTSIAGNAIGTGAVLDFSRHLNRVLEIDPEKRTATVQAGAIMSTLQTAAAPYHLRFGPDPSTQNRAAFGGMIGNNACGPHAVAYGRTSDNTLELDCIDGRGRRFTAGKGDPTYKEVPGLAELVADNLAIIRTEFGRFQRQISGYSLEHLLPENGSDLAKALVGTEGTCVTVLNAKLNLVPMPKQPNLVVLGYEDMPKAADDIPRLLAIPGKGRPLAIEGLDARLIEIIQAHMGAKHVPPLPQGRGWLMIEVEGDTPEQAMLHAEAVVAASTSIDSQILPAGPDAARMWSIRADGAGLAGRTLANQQAWPGWEDSAVLPEHLGAYLRDLLSLLDKYGFDGVPYGHFGDGCIHMRVDFPLERPGKHLGSRDLSENGSFRAFMEEAGDLVVKYGGSMSGEHGDGRARSELLTKMYSPQAIELLGKFKALFDPASHLNPGVITSPNAKASNDKAFRLDGDLRRPLPKPIPANRPAKRDGRAHPHGHLHGVAQKAGYFGFSFSEDDHDLIKAAHRCMGVGKCRAGLGGPANSFMCPSYQATRDEKDVTRGRARVLQEAVNGSLIHGLTSPEVLDSLDLCLSCKACSSDCPAVVDIARWKSEVLHRKYKGHVRPVDHYVLGWLPRWARLVGEFGPLVPVINAVLGFPPITKLVLKVGGMAPERKLMAFAPTPFRKWWRKHGETLSGPPVVLWTDSFSDTIAPNVPEAAVKVLSAAGYRIIVPEKQACCGLTWISTGQLDGARKRMENLMAVLGPYAVNGIPIVGLEPSCTAVLRSDLVDLFPNDPRAKAIAAATRTFAELLTDPATAPQDWTLPDMSDLKAVVQPHCHHHSVMGYGADEKLLRNAGAQIEVLSGCCGLAGNFGMQKGHYEVSVAVAENALLPALRKADNSTAFLADGFSCRTQALQLADKEGKALVEVIAERLR